MKKVLLMLMLSAMFFATSGFAEFTPAVTKLLEENGVPPAAEEEKSDFPNFVCVDSVTYSLLPKNLDNMIYSGNSTFTMVVIPGTEKADKKNNTISVWLNVILTFEGVDFFTSDYNDYGKELYKNYGYQKILVTFNTKTKKYKLITKTDYTCSGVVIKTFDNYTWDHIVPDSVTEDIYNAMKKKFKM